MQLNDEIRYAIRQFRNAPGFTATAVLTLALGIGATTAIFTLAHAVLLKSLPVANPSELYRVGDAPDCCVNGGLQDSWNLFSYDQYKDFRDRTQGFREMAAFQTGRSLIGVRRNADNRPAESYLSEYVSGNYFSMFGVQAYAGRIFSPADDRKEADPVAIMSYRTWQLKYGQDPSVVGSAFTINGHPFTVVGIAPPGFFGDELTEHTPALWLPLNSEPLVTGPNTLLEHSELGWLDIIGRIAPGADPKSIEARMQVELKQWLYTPASKLSPRDQELIPKQTLHLSAGGAGVQMMRDEYEDGLRLLLWISGLVLLIACANVANLMLVRATTRKQQTSIRAALGASRWILIRQVLTESIVLGLFGGIVGVAFAFACTRLILHLAFQGVYVPISATPSLPVLAFATAVSTLTGILFGVVPAWFTAHADPADALRGASRSVSGKGAWTQRSLVVAQAAMSLVLLCSAALLTQSLRNMQNLHFGFEMPNRYILHVDPQMAGYKPEDLNTFYRQLREALTRIPGVLQMSYSIYTPMEGNNWSETVYIEGQAPPPPDSNQNNSSWVRVSDGYFDTLGIKIVEGRAISDQDTQGTRPVAVVNRAFADHFFKDQSAIGKHFGYMEARYAGTYEIVGVTENTYYRQPSRPVKPVFYLAAAQRVTFDVARYNQFEDRSHYLNTIALRTGGPVAGLEPQVRHALAELNPNLALIDFTTFADQVDGNFTQPAMIAKLTSLFGLLALALASVGLYGVTAYWVERRTAEIGIRMALGADRTSIIRLVMHSALLQIAAALLLGVPATIAAGRVMATQLFGVKAYDPATLLFTAAVLTLAAAAAALVPARRAAALEPMTALRSE